jgi:hypothetical protein
MNERSVGRRGKRTPREGGMGQATGEVLFVSRDFKVAYHSRRNGRLEGADVDSHAKLKSRSL